MGYDDEGYEDEEEDETGAEQDAGLAPRASFYVTELSTIAVFHVGTCGLYSLYWFYQHWSIQKRVRGLRISPLGRAIFAVFFVHRLFELIDRGARAAGRSPRWNPRARATWFVLASIAAGLVGRLGFEPVVSAAIAYALGIINLFGLLAAQRVANLTSAHLDEREAEPHEEEDEDEDEE